MKFEAVIGKSTEKIHQVISNKQKTRISWYLQCQVIAGEVVGLVTLLGRLEFLWHQRTEKYYQSLQQCRGPPSLIIFTVN